MNAVLDLLRASLNSTDHVRKPAEEQLLNLETSTGYSSTLLDVVVNRNVDSNLRLAAIVRLKNVIEKSWKKRMTGLCLSDEEKSHLRIRFLQALNEPTPSIALQLALLIANIARFDLPQHWPELIPSLMQLTQTTSNQVERHNALHALQQVIKVLSSRRLAQNKREFEEMSPKLFSYASSIWKASASFILTGLSSFSNGQTTNEGLASVIPVGELTKLATKLIKTVVTFGISDFDKIPELVEFFKYFTETYKQFVLCKFNLAQNCFSAVLQDLVLLCGKLVLELQNSQPLSFRHWLPTYLEFAYNQVLTTNLSESSEDERFIIQCMILIKNIIECNEYSEEYSQLQESVEAQAVIKQFFSLSTLTNLCKAIIVRHMPLTISNLEDWSSDPENFWNESESDSWQDRRKPCAETLFITILAKQSEILPLVVQLVQELLKSQNSANMEYLLLKDSCYTAIGLGYYYLYDYVDFNTWFSTELTADLKVSDPNFKIIHRRVAWLIGYWVGKISKDMRKNIYSTILTLMYNNDLVVALTAAKSLKSLIDDVDFSVEVFIEFLEPTLQLLFKLLSQVQECDAKLQVLDVVAVVISQLESKIAPYTSKMIEFFQMLWVQCGNNEAYNLLKQSIVSTIVKLATCIMDSNESSQVESLVNFAVPLIKHSTDITKPESVYLLEEGLSLWLTVLSHVNVLSSGLLSIYPHITAIMSNSFEHTKIAMKILEEYLVLGKAEFLKLYLQEMLFVLDNTLGNVKDLPTLWTLKPVELFVQLFPKEGAAPLQNILTKLVFEFLFDDEVHDQVAAHTLAIFCRLLLDNKEFFFAFFHQISQDPRNKQRENLVYKFVDVLLEKLDSMTQQRIRKLTGLALCNLLISPDVNLLNYTAQIINACISVMHSSHQSDEDLDVEDWGFDEPIITGSAVKKMLYKTDPVFSFNVQQVLLQKLNESAQLHGAAFQQAISAVDPTLLKQLQETPNKQ